MRVSKSKIENKKLPESPTEVAPEKQATEVTVSNDYSSIVEALRSLSESIASQRDDNKMLLLLKQSSVITELLRAQKSPEVKVEVPPFDTTVLEGMMKQHLSAVEALTKSIDSRPTNFEIDLIRDEYGMTKKALIKGVRK